MKGKTIPILIIALVVIAILIAVIVYVTDDKTTTTTTTTNTNSGGGTGGGPAISFADCITAGGTVMESYPRKCTTTEGETFIEDVGNEIEKADLIRITNPRPNDSITSPTTITGQARGTWFFEGEFPIFIHDVQNQLICQASATAQGDWMTEEFVAYEATLEFTEPAYGPGTLYLNKHNVSDNADLDDALIIPVDFPLVLE